MAMTINHNLMAMNTSRNLSDHYGKLGVSTRRLSSGLRVGTAADDAAGLAIRELMRADIASTNQGVRNANDAVSLVQTADGALSVIDEKLIRMRELSTQASTGTYTSDQRLVIDSEYQAMASEISRIARATNFNGIHLLDGTLMTTSALKVHFGSGNSSAEDYYSIKIGVFYSSALGPGLSLETNTDFRTATAGDYAYSQSLSMSLNQDQSSQNDDMVSASVRAYINDQRANYITNNSQASWDKLDVREKYRFEYQWGKTETDSIAETGSLYSGAVLNGNNQQKIEIGKAAGGAFSTYNGVTIYSQSDAQGALGSIDSAIREKDDQRASLGAMQNRLSNTIQNLQIQAENLQASESRISDVDVAQEMTSFVSEQILTQSATAMLAQANSLPKMALQLIQGG